MPADQEDAYRRKALIRHEAHARRDRQTGRDQRSRAILDRLAALPEYAASGTILFYVDARSEVRTREFLATAAAAGKRVVVPYCVGDELELFRMEDLTELATGVFGILEPRQELRNHPNRRVEPDALDMVVVPGVAFDRSGGRLGHGKGYYDKLLVRIRPDAHIVAVAYECQLFPEVPMLPHDVRMHKVVTESAVYTAGSPGRVR
jgi:5-formyltetrahydrofolate cyclo-ligase